MFGVEEPAPRKGGNCEERTGIPKPSWIDSVVAACAFMPVSPKKTKRGDMRVKVRDKHKEKQERKEYSISVWQFFK